MNIHITGVHIEVTEAIRDYVHSRFEGMSKYAPKDDTSARISVELSKTTEHHHHGDMYRTEVVVHHKGKDTVIHATEDDLYKAIDSARDKTVRELTQLKDKQLSVFRRGAHKIKQLLRREPRA